VLEFEYDAFGRRVKKVADGREIRYLWDDVTLMAESDGANRCEYVMDRFVPLMQINSAGLHFYHVDYQGRPREVTNESGQIVWEGQYQAYGRLTSSRGSLRQPFGFPGQYLDEESGLYYSLFRFYDPDNGRFITPDPLGLTGGLNLYNYVDDPIHTIDPLGLAIWPTKPVPYGGSSMQSAIDSHYEKIGGAPNSGGDLVAMRYDTPGGKTKVKVFQSGGKAGHAENAMLKWMDRYKIDPMKVKEIYSELQPCDKEGEHCMSRLMERFKNNDKVKIEFSFYYPEGVRAKYWAAKERREARARPRGSC
jgi:RHS repeat-associated protein